MSSEHKTVRKWKQKGNYLHIDVCTFIGNRVLFLSYKCVNLKQVFYMNLLRSRSLFLQVVIKFVLNHTLPCCHDFPLVNRDGKRGASECGLQRVRIWCIKHLIANLRSY